MTKIKQTNFESAMEVVGQALDLLSIDKNVDTSTTKIVNTLLSCAENGYVLVEWPESQDFMEEEWFQEEAVCAVGSEDRFGSAAYFIPIKRII